MAEEELLPSQEARREWMVRCPVCDEGYVPCPTCQGYAHGKGLPTSRPDGLRTSSAGCLDCAGQGSIKCGRCGGLGFIPLRAERKEYS
jgi:DnaJ-class molecular chaperone